MNVANPWPHNATKIPNPWMRQAIGYKDAGDIIATGFVTVMHRRDALAYPVVFLYRQYMELALKALIRQAQDYHGIAGDCPHTHRLDGLWRLLRELIQGMGCSSGDETEQTGRLINEFCTIDPLSQAFRYPEDRDGNPCLTAISEVNIVNMQKVVAKIAFLFECVDLMIQGCEWARRQGVS